HERESVRTVNGLPLTIAEPYVGDGRSRGDFHHPSVRAFVAWYADRACAFDNGHAKRIGLGCGLNEDRSRRASVLRVRGAVPVLDATIDVEYRFVIPARVGRLRR